MNPSRRIPGFSFESPSIRPLTITLNTVTVQAQERTLRATWTPELAQDLAGFHNIDAEAQLTALLSEQLTQEIDREIMNGLIGLGPTPTDIVGFSIESTSDGITPNRRIKSHHLVEPQPQIIPLPTNDDGWANITFPQVRNVQPMLIGQDIEPLPLPQGRLFYFVPQFAVTADPTVLDSGAWYMDDTFESEFIKSKMNRVSLT